MKMMRLFILLLLTIPSVLFAAAEGSATIWKFAAIAYTCVDQDLPKTSSQFDDMRARRTATNLIEHFERGGKLLEAFDKIASDPEKQPPSTGIIKDLKEYTKRCEADAIEIMKLSHDKVPSLDTASARGAHSALITYIQSVRARILPTEINQANQSTEPTSGSAARRHSRLI
tara:strand:- start:5 stop:520 length:516 start_codon:yes stop_codon:yes gene_type:complete